MARLTEPNMVKTKLELRASTTICDGIAMRRVTDLLKSTRAALVLIATALLLAYAAPASAETPAELISSFRLKHGEVRVVRDTTLDRIAQEQARAMAEKDELSHEVLGSFSSRISPSRAGRAAENIAYGYDTFDKTLDQWIASSEHRKNLLLSKATRVGIASAKDKSGKRTYWAMEIAGDYEPKAPKGGRAIADASKQGPLVKREVTTTTRRKSSDCHIKLLSLCI
jgi:Cysteine-rich secretory protein family